jgi:hypothetical protein
MFGTTTQSPLAHQHRHEKPSRIWLIPALTLIVFTRRRIGGRMLNLLWLLPMAAALFLIQPLCGRSLDDHALRIFAVLVVVFGVTHRLCLEAAKRRGGPMWHSYSRGESWLSFLPLPAVFIHVVLDPALCGWLGWKAVENLSPWLGYWLMFSAFMLSSTEFHDYRHQFHRGWDIRDGEVEGRVQSEAIMSRLGGTASSAAAASRRAIGLTCWAPR